MSIRYGIDLVLQPSFTARVYQTRQIVCGQYSAWAAEMQMLRMRLTPFFLCPDDSVTALNTRLEIIADRAGKREPYSLRRAGISVVPETSTVVMNFDAPDAFFELQRTVAEAAAAQSNESAPTLGFRPVIALLEYGSFPVEILEDAGLFAEGVASELVTSQSAMPWRLLLTRYSSDVAGEDWGSGGWASDLSWQQVASHALFTPVHRSP